MLTDFSEFPRRPLYAQMNSGEHTFFTTAERVGGIIITNTDSGNAGVAEFFAADEVTSIFRAHVPAGQTLVVPIKFFANNGLYCTWGVANDAFITVFVCSLSSPTPA